MLNRTKSPLQFHFSSHTLHFNTKVTFEEQTRIGYLHPFEMCPPGVDQTTRTEERWTLLAPCLQQRCDLVEGLEGHYRSRDGIIKIITRNVSWAAFARLAKYKRDEEKAFSLLSSLDRYAKPDHGSSIEVLPIEIFNMILRDLCLRDKDVVSLGMASQTLWQRVLQHILNDCQHALWAGSPLLCTGTWTMSMPPTIHSLRPELKEAEKEYFDAYNSGFAGRGVPRIGACPARRFNWKALGSYAQVDVLFREWLYCFDTLQATSGIPTKGLNILRRSVEVIVNPCRSSLPTQWVLRNHDTRETVSLKTSRSYGKHEYYVHVKGMPWLQVDKALLLRISWSAAHEAQPWDDEEEDEDSGYDSRAQKQCAAKVKRGKWAGHRFEIVPDHGFSCEEEKDGWRDVTQELIGEARALKTLLSKHNDNDV